MNATALLALADGTVMYGESVGAAGTTVGEVVFNTSMTGYQEILTDPSYRRQLVTLTYPHIGNVGVNPEDMESREPQLAGLIVREATRVASNWRSTESLPDYLAGHGVVAIAGLDTRRLTRLVREQGAQSGCIMGGDVDPDAAIERAREFAGLKGMDLALEAGTREIYTWAEGSWRAPGSASDAPAEAEGRHVVVYDFGTKFNILRRLVDCGCMVTVVPPDTTAEVVLAMAPDGVVLSNGPGDPEPCDYAIRAARELIHARMPLFGICLGHQLLGLAAGGRTVKMKFGHHGANHPVLDMASGQVWISSQNHGFEVDEATLPDNIKTTHRSLFDNSLQGVELRDAPAFSFQGHPEASPGPRDVAPLFRRFVTLMAESGTEVHQ